MNMLFLKFTWQTKCTKTIITKNQIKEFKLKLTNLALIFGKMQESVLFEITPLIHTSAI